LSAAFTLCDAGTGDSLYWECDTVPHGRASRIVSLAAAEDPGCESTQPCGPEREGSRTLPDGSVETFHFRMRNQAQVKDGAFEIRDRAGRVKQQGSYSSGKRSGEWVSWYPDGKRRSVEHYLDGKLNGLHREYYPNGRLMDEFKYRDGILDCRDGYHKSWYEGGALKFEMEVRDRKLAKYVFYDTLGKELRTPILLNR
jgi:antitoxin component YwqK of YwqJK toxin-antitoxin module